MSMLEGKGRHGGRLNHSEGSAMIEGHIMKKILILYCSSYQGQKLGVRLKLVSMQLNRIWGNCISFPTNHRVIENNCCFGGKTILI